jgi:hypothetical protein
MERPIIFSGEIIRAILEEKKTQTRRIHGLEDVNKYPDLWTFVKIGILDYKTKRSAKGKFGAYFTSELIEPKTISICPQVCPFGQPGDQLWVRETFSIDTMPFEGQGIGYMLRWKAGGERKEYFDGRIYPYPIPDKYRMADKGWRPSIFMPRWASRITLEIVSVRVERVQDISEEDAIVEGAPLGRVFGEGKLGMKSHREGFIDLWNSINGKKYPWESNPWVWKIEFRKIN